MGYSLDDIIKGTVGILKSNIASYQTDPETVYSRLDLCRDCPYLKISTNKITKKTIFKCGVCGCFLKAKTKIKTEKCPKGFW